jgi:chromosome segregation protein
LLKLKRVEIQGFKSFCERTELRFNGDGIAAIVGPNGCGKSNLSDAISWVLGEQSAKTLRGSRMEDVIFAGTRDRKPLGMASVTMTLVDPEFHRDSLGHKIHAVEPPAEPGGPPKRPGEVIITRRLFRSGESEYLIDGHIARLRDIQDIFMGTGLGPESYAIIEQGRIGQILSSKPQDRRGIIEEAAGITKYKSRRRLAEARLESAKQNLARVFDILEEVTRQANSLKRQAARARRFGDLKAEMEARLRVMLSSRFRLLEREAAKVALDLNVATAGLRDITGQVADKEQEHAERQAACYATEQELTQARARLAELNLEAERTRLRLQSQVKEVAATEERIAQAEREAQELAGRLTALETEIAAHQTHVAELEAHIAGARGRMLEVNRQREALQARVRECEASIEAGRQAILRLLGEAANLKNQLAQLDEYLAGIDRETARSTREEQVAAAEIERLDASASSLHETMAKRQLELEAVTGERHRTEEDLGSRRQAAVELRRQIDTLRDECSKLRARKESIENVLAHRTYTTESVRRLFAEIEKGRAVEFQPLGVLADFVEVDPQFEKPAEEFLHDELEYVVVKTWDQASGGLDFVRAELDGRATFLVHPEPGGRGIPSLPEPAIGPETGIAGRLSDALRLTNGLSNRAADLLPRVSLCFLAEDHAAARRLAVAYPYLYFLLADGVCYHGHTLAGGKKNAAGPLALKREARELVVTLAGRRQTLAAVEAEHQAAGREIAAQESELERLRGLQQAREKDRVALEHEMRSVADSLSRANARVSVARLELERLRRDTEKSLEQRERGRAAVQEKELGRAAREEALEGERRDLEALEAQTATVSEEHSLLRAQLAQFEERHRGERAAMSRLEQQFGEISTRHAAIAPLVDQWGLERARLLADNIDLDRRSVLLAAGIVEVDIAAGTLAAEEADLRDALAQGDEHLKSMRAGVQTAQEARSQLEIDLVKKEAELKYLDETSRKELDLAVADIAGPDEPLPSAEALAEAERQYEEVRGRIEALGPVNPQAMEEFQEAQQRHDFLTAQRQDLLDSIRDTEKAIQDIDEVSRQRFSEAYEAINLNFKETFVTLFGGGVAEMRLTDETNAAESGIDLVCSPPGKRLQSVLLLSGGEKALAAIALLMAIFRYQPSPFCVLDEVDAPLDEANIGRLCLLLKEMALQTQFVLITHSKKTMEAAQALYGVTMQEQGVSRLVSVRFNAAETAAVA